MDLKQIEYIIKIAEENNITRAAEKLFITQSALNQQLLKLEKELGTQLFYRSRTNFHPTAAGEVYLKNAKEILHIKYETYKMINDIAETKRGRLSIGFTPGRGITMFTSVYPIFHRLYPHITVEPTEMSVHSLQSLIHEGELDIGFLTLCEKHKTNDNYINIHSEEIILVIPAGHPLSKYANPAGQPFATLEISQLKYEPFVLMNKESTMRSLVNDIFEQANFTPNVLFETKNNSTILAMIESNLCCGLIPYYYIKDGHKGMACFSLPSKPNWEVVASFRKNSYLSNIAIDFIHLVQNFWTQ